MKAESMITEEKPNNSAVSSTEGKQGFLKKFHPKGREGLFYAWKTSKHI